MIDAEIAGRYVGVGGLLSARRNGLHICMTDRPRHIGLARLMQAARPRHRTAASAVTEVLRSAIINGLLPAGMPLRQTPLASDLGVSRMPIRESIRRLETEGLVDFVPHCGAVVATLLVDDIRELAQMRVRLECLALERALAAPDALRLDAAETVLIQLDAADSLIERNALNRRFHTALYGTHVSARLCRHIELLYDAYERFLLVEHSQLDRRARSQNEHRAIVAACRAGDAKNATDALVSHIEGAADELVRYLLHQAGDAQAGSAMPKLRAD